MTGKWLENKPQVEVVQELDLPNLLGSEVGTLNEQKAVIVCSTGVEGETESYFADLGFQACQLLVA